MKLQFDCDGLDLSVLLKAVLTQFAANSGLLESTERRGGVEDVVAIHPDDPQCGTLLAIAWALEISWVHTAAARPYIVVLAR